jgi:hypothetical protein
MPEQASTPQTGQNDIEAGWQQNAIRLLYTRKKMV